VETLQIWQKYHHQHFGLLLYLAPSGQEVQPQQPAELSAEWVVVDLSGVAIHVEIKPASLI